MTEKEFTEYKDKSKSMFNEVCDPDSLMNINLEALTMQGIINRFLSTKASKTDFGVLVGMLKFWDKETSIINLESYSHFRSITGSSLANANLSRALKSLEVHEFIRKVGSHNKLEYPFDIAYDILCAEIG